MDKKKKSLIKEITGYAIFTVALFLLFTFVIKVAYVDGDSMNDTYKDGDAVLCLRIGEVEKGDVVVCDCDAGVVLIKRIIATEGDTLDINFETSEVIVNGVVIDEPYIKEPTKLNREAFEYPITIPEDCYFVMGDNRNASDDSRTPQIGYIKEEQIQGKVLFKLPFLN